MSFIILFPSAKKDEKKLFAIAFMRSMKLDGTAVEDGEHELFVYRVSLLIFLKFLFNLGKSFII